MNWIGLDYWIDGVFEWVFFSWIRIGKNWKRGGREGTGTVAGNNLYLHLIRQGGYVFYSFPPRYPSMLYFTPGFGGGRGVRDVEIDTRSRVAT